MRSWRGICRTISAVVFLTAAAGAMAQSTVVEANEGDEDAHLLFTIHREGGDEDLEAAFSYQTETTEASTATAGVDYTAVSGRLTFAAGESEPLTVRVPIIDDTIDEDDETVVFRISDLSNLELLRESGTGYIRDDDDPPQLSVSDVSATEGDGSLTFDVELDQQSGRTVTASYTTVNVTATAPADYAASSGALTFTPGETAKTVTVAIVDDADDEPDETLVLRITSVENASTDSLAQATGTIVDDDDPHIPDVEVTVSTVQESASKVVFSVVMKSAPSVAITLSYATADGTAVAGDDYVTTSGTRTFEAGSLTSSVTVAIVDDNVSESNEETFELVVRSQADDVLARATATIIDDDVSYFTVSSTSMRVDEDAGFAVIDIGMTRPSTDLQSLDYHTQHEANTGTNFPVDDYVHVDSTVEFLAGETSKSVSVAIVEDDYYENNPDFFEVVLDGSRPFLHDGMLRDTLTVKVGIEEDDRRPQFSVRDASSAENGGSLRFRVTLSGKDAESRSYQCVTESGGTATGGVDYRNTAKPISFSPGVTTRDCTVQLIDDLIHEPDETVKIRQATGTILDNDADRQPGVGIRVVDGQAAEAWEDDSPLTFAVQLNGESGFQVKVDYATSDDTAVAGDDYVAASGTLTFEPGELLKNIPVTLIDDELEEGDEYVDLTLSNAVHSTLGEVTAQGRIRDDDSASVATIDIADAVSVEEGNDLHFVVSLTHAIEESLSIPYRHVSGTANSSDRRLRSSEPIELAAGETSATIVIRAVNDSIVEPEQDFSVVITPPDNPLTRGGRLVAQGSIIDNDSSEVTVVATAPVSEGTANPRPFRVKLSKRVEATVYVNRDYLSGTAKEGSDWRISGTFYGSLIFNPFETSRDIDIISYIDNRIHEPSETFDLRLNSVSTRGAIAENKVTLGPEADRRASATILDDDPLMPSVGGHHRRRGRSARVRGERRESNPRRLRTGLQR